MENIIDQHMAAIRRDKGSGEKPRWRSSEGRWRARYIDSQGKRRSVYSTIPGRAGAREAAAKRDEAIRRAELGIVHNTRLTVGDLLERWLAEVAPLRLRPSSLERYRGIIRGQLVPTLGRIPLASLTPEHVARAYAEARPGTDPALAHSILTPYPHPDRRPGTNGRRLSSGRRRRWTPRPQGLAGP
ncbi:MAG: hypothetical protein ACRDG7_03135 [Candidatus Limnocylindria bacterium]